MMAISFVLVNSFSKKKDNRSAPSRGQEKLTYLIYFPWPLLEVEQ